MRCAAIGFTIGLTLASSSAWSGVMSIGPGVTANVTVDQINVITTAADITNVTKKDAFDFHFEYVQGVTVLFRDDYSTTSTNPLTLMSGPVMPGGTLMVGNKPVTIRVGEDVGVIKAYWTDKKGDEIPEPASLGLVGVGVACLGLIRWRTA